jgi:hypothetical protein
VTGGDAELFAKPPGRVAVVPIILIGTTFVLTALKLDLRFFEVVALAAQEGRLIGRDVPPL